MKIISSCSPRPIIARWLFGAGFFILAGAALETQAQGILAQPPSLFGSNAVSHNLNPSYVPSLVNPPAPSPGIYQWGALDFHPHLLYRLIYGDGIPAAPTNHVTTAIQEVSPGLMIMMGTNLTLDYTPTVRVYSSPKFPNSTDELVVLNGVVNYNNWGYQLSQNYSETTTPLEETEALTTQVNYLTTFNATRLFGDHYSAQFGVNQNFRFTALNGVDQDIHEWTGHVTLADQIWTRFGVNATATGGYDLDSPGADMTFESFQGALNWVPGDKLTISAGGGVEVRQLLGANLINPLFNGSIIYQPWPNTAATLTATRTVEPSYFANEILVNTTVAVSLSQRFYEHFTLEANGGYTTLPFVGFEDISEFPNSHQLGVVNPTVAVQQSREDINRFVTVRLTAAIGTRGTVSVFYSYEDISSGLAAYALMSKQVGVELGWRY